MTTVRKMPPPPPPAAGASRQAAAQAAIDPNRFIVTTGVVNAPQTVLMYGPGGVGKTTLASLAPNAIILDIEGGSMRMGVNRIDKHLLATFQDVRDALRSPAIDSFQTVVIDSATRLEDLVAADVVATVPHEKGHMVERIEDYGYGKGASHIYDKFLLLLADCDALLRRGKNIIIIAHDCTDVVPNPVGEDYIRYEPRLSHPKSGNLKASVRSRIYEWVDHCVFVSRDVATKNGKGVGGDTRTIYTMPSPSHKAKSRTSQIVLPFADATDGALWDELFNLNSGGQE